jgi:hypothetical protein
VKASEWAKDVIAADQPIAAIPWVREWLGDEAIQSIWFPPERDPDEYEKRHLKRVFPETELHRAPYPLIEYQPSPP